MTKQSLVYTKSNWKRKCRRMLSIMGKTFEDVYYGRRPNMFDLLDYAEKLHALGMAGVGLNDQLVKAGFGARAKQDISKVLRRIEVTSKHLVDIAEKFGMPMADTPQFVNPLVLELADPLSSYEELMSTKDREAEE